MARGRLHDDSRHPGGGETTGFFVATRPLVTLLPRRFSENTEPSRQSYPEKLCPILGFAIGSLIAAGSFIPSIRLAIAGERIEGVVAQIDTFYRLHSDWAVTAAPGCLSGFVSLIFCLLSRAHSQRCPRRLY